MKSDLTKLGLDCKWSDLTEGMQIYEGGTSAKFHTGEWTAVKPDFDAEKCTQCLLCVPVCPDSAIPVSDYKRGDFDYNHCKGCGICVNACKPGAITMKGVNK